MTTKTKCIRLEECVGKQIKAASQDGALVMLRFDDESVCLLEADYEGADVYIAIGKSLNLEDSGVVRCAFRTGVLSKDEASKAHDAIRSKHSKQRRAQYEVLKAEFGE